jgi:glycosyltransferase involved in cell wall biosynthesis
MEQQRPQRIMQVIARMNVGGPAVIVAELMQGLNPSTFQVRLLTGYCADNEADYLDELTTDFDVVRVSGLGRSVSILADIKSFFHLVRLIREYQPDLIHTHTAKAGALGRIAGLIACPHAKRIHTYHGHLLHGYFSPWKTQLIVKVERILARFSAFLIAIGNHVKTDLLGARIGKMSQYIVLLPGLGELTICDKSKARNELGLEIEKTYLVFVGRLTQIKRPDRLVDIARHLKVNHPKVEMLIAGSGEKFWDIRGLAELESLPMLFLGWRTDIGRILSASDLAILCSDNEGVPLSLIQATQAGLPIVSTDVGSVSDIVVHGKTGILTEVNSQSLIAAIDSLLSNPIEMAQFGRAGKLRFDSFFSLKGMIQAHEKLYSQAIQVTN